MTATECIQNDYVILVDENDQAIGTAEKLSAHQQNLLHRAFSVFIFRKHMNNIELLLQQRALHKYHSGGLWTNTCCSHPKVGETIVAAGERRLKEELGIEAPLKDTSWFHYNAHFENGLSENEIDHVLVGFLPEEAVIEPNPAEVHAIRWITVPELEAELQANPERFTPWLLQAFAISRASLLSR